MMNRNFHVFLCVGAALWRLGAPLPAAQAQPPPPAPSAPPAAGINIALKDGRQAVATALRMQRDILSATQQVGAGTGEIGYPVATIAKVDFPKPSQIAGAANLLVQDKAAAALAQIDPIVTYYAPFKTVPGNWWLPAALTRLDALAALKREPETDALLGEVSRLPNSPAAAEAARVRAAEASVRRGNLDKAEPVFDDLISHSADEDTLARAWLGKGRILLGRKDFESALLAFLHVPVLYEDNRLLMPPALFGSGQAFVGLERTDRARTAFEQVIAEYAAAPEAATAKNELQRLDAKAD